MAASRFERAGGSDKILICVSLNPIPQISELRRPFHHLASVAKATAEHVSAYMLNLEPFEPDLGGTKTLRDLLKQLPANNIKIAEGGYIEQGVVGRQYTKLIFDDLDFHAVVTTPFLGFDFIAPFVERRDRLVFLRCSSPEPGTKQRHPQQFMEGEPLIEHVAELTNQWNHHDNLGLVIGATDLAGLTTARRLCPNLPILVTSADGADVDLGRVVVAGLGEDEPCLVVQSERDIVYASMGDDFTVSARAAARGWRRRLDDLTIAVSAARQQ